MTFTGWDALLFVMLCAGHAKLWAEALNRLHARPYRCRTLHRLRVIHDLAAVAFPVVLLALAAQGWTFADVPPRSQSAATMLGEAYLTGCLGGFVWLMWSAAEHWVSRPPAAQLSNHSERIDVAGALGSIPIGNGLHPHLARLPRNEQFCVEVNRKLLVHPSLPAHWDRLRILHLSDWHFHGTVALPYFEYVSRRVSREPVDLIVFTGDLMDDMKCLDWIGATLGRLSAPLGQYFILGNHDWYLQPEQIRAALAATGWTDVSSRYVSIRCRNRLLAIGGDETPWMGRVPVGGDEADFRLLLSHTPDHFPRSREQGTELVLAGHNHGGQVKLPILGPVFSPSRYGTRYASGTFFEGRTLMHVSRGLSGRHPYRWNCLPEVSVLELRKQG